MKKRTIVILSPFLIMLVNVIVAVVAGQYIGKWAFVPIILIEWTLFLFFILVYGGKEALVRWLKPSKGGWGWIIVTLLIAITPLPIFLKYHNLLASWQLIVPWILLALVNPWLEEFYWRGLLMDYSKNWGAAWSILFTSIMFSINHAVFGIQAELFRGPEILISTFLMGLVWAITYKRTDSLRWVIFAHFLADFFNLSSVSFLDLFKPGW